MQRKSTIQIGVMTNPSQFNPKLEWDSLPRNNWTNVGIHACDCKPVGVKENAKSVFLKVFPNPANGSEIAFVSDKVVKEISIVNTIGQVVFTFRNAKEENTVVLKNLGLANGVYYAIVKNEVGTTIEKLIIQ